MTHTTALTLPEMDLFRVEGLWIDNDLMSWVDTGRTQNGQRVYTDGVQFVVRSGSKLSSRDIKAEV